MKHIALVGNPNSGKTTLFNSLTGSTARVGNWAGVTVDKREGLYKKSKLDVYIIDLPGIYSLSPYTSEEVISRNYILDEKPDCVINIVDATNLERNLYLTTQLMEIDVPIVVALNMIDVIHKNGDSINVKQLQDKIGLPVVEISALKEENLTELMDVAIKECDKKRNASTILEHTALRHVISDIKISFDALNVDNPLFHSIKLVEMDELEIKNHPNLVTPVNEYKKSFNDDIFGDDFEAVIADSRYRYITKNYSPALKRNSKTSMVELASTQRARKIDKVLTHKLVGIPIFIVILFLIFHLTFSEDLLFLNSIGILGAEGIVSFTGTTFEGLFANGGINSPGVILFNLIGIISEIITELFTDWFSSSPEWIQGLIVDGVLGGVLSVISFLPQILCLFLFFSILEDSGYMARVAFILDRIFRKFGLSGRAFLPMIMGFGCSVPAMINTRTLADENERTATIRVIPFFSCGAKLPILTAISGGIVQSFNIGNADIITYSMYLIGIITAMVTVIMMRNTTMRGEIPPFIMELPNYHLPQFKSLMMHLWDKLKHFIQKAFTIILASTIIIWFVSHFDWGWHLLSDNEIDKSILAGIGQLLQPLFTPLGFGSQIGAFGWVFVVASITGLIAKENMIATLGTLAACIVGISISEDEGGVSYVILMVKETGITVPALISLIAFNMLTIPCFAAVATARAELGKKKFATTILFWITTSYIVSTIIYLVGSWWWTLIPILFVLALVIFVIKLYNEKRPFQGNK